MAVRYEAHTEPTKRLGAAGYKRMLRRKRTLALENFQIRIGAGLFGSQLLKAAADRRQEVDFAGLPDRIGQAPDPHLAIDRNVDA
jgi:hypothetical protein